MDENVRTKPTNSQNAGKSEVVFEKAAFEKSQNEKTQTEKIQTERVQSERTPELVKNNLSNELRNIFVIDEIKAEVYFWKRCFDHLGGRTGGYMRTNYFNRICGLCLAEPKEQKLWIKFRKMGLQKMNLFLIHSTRKEVQGKEVKLLTWSCLNLLSFYYLRRQVPYEDCNCFKTSKFEQAKALLRNAMYLILPEKQEEVIKFTIKYFTLTSQWNTDDFDSFVFQELLAMITKPEILLAKIIKEVEHAQKQGATNQALNISCTLSTILENVYWDKYLFNYILHNCLNTLLKIYLLSDALGESKIDIEKAKLRAVTKASIKNFISNIKDNKGLVSVMDSLAKCLHDTSIIKEDRLEITEMVVFCAQRHHTKFYRESITPDLLELLLNNLRCDDRNLVAVSHKIFHCLLDRRGNMKSFTEPVYYFKGRSDFVVNYDYSTEDVHFVKSFSKNFLEGIHQSLIKFHDKYELVLCYITVCLILVEVPEPVITINVIHVIISTQDEIIKSAENFPLATKAHIHAIVSAIMSLICLIHQDEVTALKRYVEEVIRFRTENSPHLLPPLQNKYSLASHHTTEYHEQLYFLEEEVLYALQRCWLTRKSR